MGNYLDFRRQYDTELVYTRRQMDKALEDQAKSFTVNRVIRSFDGTWNGEAMMILAIHHTPEGVLVIVR